MAEGYGLAGTPLLITSGSALLNCEAVSLMFNTAVPGVPSTAGAPGFDKVRFSASVFSRNESAQIWILAVLLVSVGAKVNTPDTLIKSTPVVHAAPPAAVPFEA